MGTAHIILILLHKSQWIGMVKADILIGLLNRKCHLNYRSLMRRCGGIDANPEILSLLLHLYQPHLIQDFLSAYITTHTPMTPSALYNILVTYPLALPKDHVIHGEGHHPFTQQFIQSLLYFPESQVWNHTKRIARK